MVAAMPKLSPTGIRWTESERELIDQARALRGESVSGFVRRATLREATVSVKVAKYCGGKAPIMARIEAARAKRAEGE